MDPIRPLRQDQQELLFRVLEDAGEYALQGDPNAALAKSAKEHGLPESLLQIAVNAFNTGQTAAQIKTGKDRQERAATVPLADYDKVLEQVYPEKVVKESVSRDYYRSPAALLERPQPQAPKAVKSASTPKDEAPTIRGSIFIFFNDIKKQAGESRSKVNQRYLMYKRAIDRLRDYFGNPSCLSYQNTLEQSTAAFGDLAPLVVGEADPGPTIKKAHIDRKLRVVPIDQEPFTLVKLALDYLEQTYDMAAEHNALCDKLRETTKKAVASQPAIESDSVLGNISPLAKYAKEIEGLLCPFEFTVKAAGIGGYLANELKSVTTNAGSQFGKMVGRPGGSPAQPQTAASALLPAKPKSIFGESERNEVTGIQGSLVLHHLLANDPDLSGYDPDQVARAYNEIQTAYPRVAANAVSVRPFLQRHLTAGGLDEFTIKNLAEAEARLASVANPGGVR